MIQIPKGSVHIDIRELNLSINYLGELGLGCWNPSQALPFPGINRLWARPGKENFPLQLGMGMWGRGSVGCVSPSVPALC